MPCVGLCLRAPPSLMHNHVYIILGHIWNICICMLYIYTTIYKYLCISIRIRILYISCVYLFESLYIFSVVFLRAARLL